MKAVGVEFKDKGKLYTFFDNDLEIKLNDKVIVNTERGLQFGKIGAIFGELNDGKDHALVYKIATEEDEIQNQKNVEEAEKALIKAQEIAEKTKLDMKFLDAFFTFDRKQLLFNFYADQRVDFRELAKILAAKYKTRIELRQIGARDKASEVGGIGVCGRKLCCAGCYKVNESITMQMAKNQNIALNPSKINGACGRLLCCLSYEDKEYVRCSKQLPSIGDTIKTPNGEGKVVGTDILNLNCKVLVGEEIVEVKINDEKDT